MPVNLKKTEFAPAGVQARSSSRIFHPEATGAGSKVQSKKTIPVETQTFTFSLFFFYIMPEIRLEVTISIW